MAGGSTVSRSWCMLLPLLVGLCTLRASAAPLQLAIVNQVHFHLEVVAGAMHVLGEFSSAPLTIYLNEKVMKTNWYGFKHWMGDRPGVIWKNCKDYDGKTEYDFVWFVSPEYHLPYIAQTTAQMKPKVGLYMVHNGHIAEEEIKKVEALTGDIAILSLAPHVANFVKERSSKPTEWILPIFPYHPANVCALEDLTAGRQCLKGFSVQGRIEKSRRNYTEMWDQISTYRKDHGNVAVSNFRLNILGEVVEAFAVPEQVADLVAVYKNPPYPIFYDVVHHSFGLVPMLANPQYYKSKFSSTVLTSMITGVPIIADQKFMDAYTFIDKSAVYFQEDGKTELDVMFKVARSDPQEMWMTRKACLAFRDKMNSRARELITKWLKEKGLEPDPDSIAGGGKGFTATKPRRLMGQGGSSSNPGLSSRSSSSSSRDSGNHHLRGVAS